jgi:hypothetical protein
MNLVEVSAFRNIGSALTGITAGTATAGGAIGSGLAGGGSFAYTPDQMRNIITKLNALAAGYFSSLNNARYMAMVEGPGLDQVSKSHANVASSSGAAYLQSIENEYRSCRTLAQQFQDTLDSYLGMEDRNTMEINQAGPPDEAGPKPGI